MKQRRDNGANGLEKAYSQGTFGISRRAFLEAAAAAGVTAMNGALLFPRTAHAETGNSTAAGAALPSGDGKLRFTVHSDTHIGCDSAWYGKPDKLPATPEKKFEKAFETIYSIAPDVRYHFFVGDTVDYGEDEAYQQLANLINTNVKRPVGILMGNHEHYTYSDNGQWQKNYSDKDREDLFRSFLYKIAVTSEDGAEKSFQMPGGANEGQTDADFVMTAPDGSHYHFIGMGPRTGGYDHSYYGGTYDDGTNRLDWLRGTIAQAAAGEDASKPIFLGTHHPFPQTVYYSRWPANGKFDDTAAKENTEIVQELGTAYPQLVHFSGHTHIPLADPRSIYQAAGRSTHVQTATFGNRYQRMDSNTDDNGMRSGSPDDANDASNCLLVEVDPATQKTTVYRLDFRNVNPVIGEPWRIDADTFRYADLAAVATAPLVSGDGVFSIKPDSVNESGCTFTIDTSCVQAGSGAANDIVFAYRIEAYGPDGAKIYDASFMSDYYRADADRPRLFERPLFGAQLAPETPYVLKAYAHSAFDKETFIGEADFTTGAKAPFGAPLLAVDFSQGKQDIAASPHALQEYGAVTLEQDQTLGEQVGMFNGQSGLGFAFPQSDYGQLAYSCTLEALVRFDAKPKVFSEFLSSTQGGGQGFAYYADGTVQQYVKNGNIWSYAGGTAGGGKAADTGIATGIWTHLVATYDMKSKRHCLYLNGKQVGAVGAVKNPIVAPTANPQRWFVGADGNARGAAENPLVGAMAIARIYPAAASEEDVAKLWEQADVVVEIPSLPEADEQPFASARAGEKLVLPILEGKGLAGDSRYGIPHVTDGGGASVALSTEQDGSYSFVPSSEGSYLVSWSFGHKSTDVLTFTVAAALKPDSGNNGGGDDNGSDGGNSGSGDENNEGGSNNNGSSGDGNGNNVSGSGSENGDNSNNPSNGNSNNHDNGASGGSSSNDEGPSNHAGGLNGSGNSSPSGTGENTVSNKRPTEKPRASHRLLPQTGDASGLISSITALAGMAGLFGGNRMLRNRQQPSVASPDDLADDTDESGNA